jgi:phage shock protein C
LEKRLTRSEKERILGGVCGGLAEYFGFDPTLVRLVFVLLALAGGAGVLIYIVLWIIMPHRTHTDAKRVVSENVEDIRQRVQELESDVRSAVTSERTQEWAQSPAFWLGLVLAIVGLVLLFSNMGMFRWLRWDVLWPLLLVVVGLLLLLWRRR